MSHASSAVRVHDVAVATAASDTWLRTLVADRLGIDEEAVSPAVSLRDDLAADSLDFADLAAAMEADLGITVPVALLARVRTYGDLLLVAETLVTERARRARDGVALLRARLSSPSRAPAAVLERVFWLDPYAVEVLAEDAERAEPGTRLEVMVALSTPAAVIARIRARLARVERRGVAVDIRRDWRTA
ncbi:MAG TPA: phosphopantetheine-binding protein [Candidatus Eisenbacteria bacterium]|nr:phosphopantetheine-binding protein [Candidatus Eisenbacteria bacterium]